MATKKLVIFWEHKTMSKGVAKKGQFEGQKKYRVEPKRTEFSVDVPVEEAYNTIYNEYGRKPELENPFGAKPFQGAHAEHGFAEIIGHKIITPFVRKQKPTP